MLRASVASTRLALAPALRPSLVPTSATMIAGESGPWYTATTVPTVPSLSLRTSSRDEDESFTALRVNGPSSTNLNNGVTAGQRVIVGPTSQFVRYKHSVSVPEGAFDKYRKSGSDVERRSFAYVMAGTSAFFAITSAKYIVRDLVDQMNASADVLALASIEVNLADIPEGTGVVVKWRGKPIFIRHRTEAEIADANSVNLSELRDPQADSERAEKAKYLVMLGICTHLGCVPLAEQGNYGGWFCPCHGSHYDISGRIRLGPAPLNLEIPPYKYVEDDKIVIG